MSTPPKPKIAPPIKDTQAAAAEAEAAMQARMRSQRGYSATNLRGGSSLMTSFLRQQTGQA